jgi:hypothetical protein
MTTALFLSSIFIMATAHEDTSPAEYTPRPPNAEEKKQLADWLLATGAYEADDAASLADCAYVAVFDHYATGCPGYVGKVISVVWDGSPSTFDVFTWEDGVMECSGREYDEKECDRCKGKGGTLCWDCWRADSRRGREELVRDIDAAIRVLSVAQERDPDQAGYYHCAATALAKAKDRAV